MSALAQAAFWVTWTVVGAALIIATVRRSSVPRTVGRWAWGLTGIGALAFTIGYNSVVLP